MTDDYRLAEQNQNDFEADKPARQSIIPNGTYPTISPLIMLHMRRLFITGTTLEYSDIIQTVQRLDKRIDPDVAERFLKENAPTWMDERERFLERQWERLLEDSAKLKELIDERYDRSFKVIQEICDQQLEHAMVLSEEGIIPNKLFNLKSVAETLEKAYSCQRLARGMAQGKLEVSHIQEGPGYLDVLAQIQESLQAKTIEAKSTVKVLEPL